MIEKQNQNKNKIIEELEDKYRRIVESKRKIEKRYEGFKQYMIKFRNKVRQQNLENDNLDMSALQLNDSQMLSYFEEKFETQDHSLEDLRELGMNEESKKTLEESQKDSSSKVLASTQLSNNILSKLN
jgi:hypothetical protein